MTALVLASGSAARRGLLERAGVPFTLDPAHIDESALKKNLAACPPHHIAAALARAKAQAVALRHLGQIILAADQLLVLNGKIFDKPRNIEEARAHLQALRGTTHTLINALVLRRDDTLLWEYTDENSLTLRDFSDDALNDYLAQAGASVLSSVGAYAIEGPAIQLFARIAGAPNSLADSIMGLPLLPLLTALRAHGILRA